MCLEKLFGKKPDNEESGVTAAASTAETVTESGTTTTEEPILPELVSNIKILVDNGHGNDTAGKRSPWSSHKVKPELDFYEYKWAREIAVPVVNELRALGYDAEILVPEESDIPLKERVARVNEACDRLGAKNVLLVSIHANAYGNGKKWEDAKGWEAYSTPGVTKSDAFAECFYTEAEKNFKGRKIRKDMSDGDSDKEANFYIIRYSNCPAVLTENFFYTNVDDTKYILSEEGRAAVVKTHVDGIINYINSL